VPPATVAERRKVPLNLSPAAAADYIIYRGGILKLVFTDEAYFRIDKLDQALYKSLKHRHIITIKLTFVKVIDRVNPR
jgi:hypothetical protein